MFSYKTRDRITSEDPGNGEASRPLLGDHSENVVFSVDDDSDEEPLAASSTRGEHSVRFREDVQVIGPPLRSTTASREAGVYFAALRRM
jgi:solute carrier family 38 (sodium-coupled neutral amino acid transporter), member 11